jgi:hypothetical protein
MTQTDLVCSKCVGRRTVNNIMMKVNSKFMVISVPPDQPLAYTERPIFVSANVHDCVALLLTAHGAFQEMRCLWVQINQQELKFFGFSRNPARYVS